MKKYYLLTFILAVNIAAGQKLYCEVNDFRKIIDDFLSLKTIKGDIEQYVYTPGGSREKYSGNYYAEAGGFIRIDYLYPERQTVVINGEGLFWYYNTRKTVFYAGGNTGYVGSVPSVFGPVSGESFKDMKIVSKGQKLYSIFRIAEVFSITSDKNKNEMIIWVDPVLKIIKRKYILDESGREILKEYYTDHILAEGLYIPSRIELNARTAAGTVTTVTEYKNMVINKKIGRELFVFRITPDMKVRRLDEK